MEFHDFQIRAWTNDREHAEVLVHSSPAGAMQHPETVVLNWEKLDSLRKIFQMTVPSLRLKGEDHLTQLAAGGRELATVVFPDQVIELLIRSLERIDPEDGLRVRLCLDGPLIDLPWEYLILPDIASLKSPGSFLALDARISLVREPPQPGSQRPRLQKKQRLLFFGTRQCNTEGKDIWETATERDRLFRALEPASTFLEMQSFLSNENDCQTALMQSNEPNDIFHYSGHTDVKDGKGYLVASDVGPEVRINLLYSNVLGPLLRRAGTTLAVFSACNSGNWAFVEPLLQAGVPVVVGAQGMVYVDVAISFCERLYSALAIGLSLDEAVTWARLHLLEPGVLQEDLQWQWGTFMVYMQTPEAILFPKSRQGGAHERQKTMRRERQNTINNVIQKTEENTMGNIKVLFLASNPNNTNQLALDEEVREITSKIRTSEYRDSIKLNSAWAVRPDDLIQMLSEHRPQIVHFSGHGSESGEIILTNDSGESKPVSSKALKALFTTLKDNIKIVVLNCCFSKEQARAITQVIDCAVGMSEAIGDKAAIIFAASFYRAIGFGRSVKDAFDQGITALLLEGIPEENTPELLVKDGVNPSEVILVDLKISPSSPGVSQVYLDGSRPIINSDRIFGRGKELEDIENLLKDQSTLVIKGFSGTSNPLWQSCLLTE
jgi:hypothetical protein